jgi:serine/threonine protein phosphatase PrpC
LAKQLRIETAELTDIGRRRSDNQDNLAQRVPEDPEELERDGALFVVADGMGGHAAGEVASTVAVQTMTETYFEAAHGEVLQGLAQAIKQSNEAILTIARENAGRTGMGTTLVAAVLCQGILYVANIGDSRAYLLRNGKLRQLTEDHSWVAEQVRAGILTEEQARNHVHRNVITRSLGTQANVTADVFVEPAREGDVLLLCSDGLHGYVSDAVIAETLGSLSTEEAAQRLIDLANEAGGPDNITVSIFRIDEMPEASPEVLAKLQLLRDQPRPTQPVPIVAKTPTRASVEAPMPPEPLGDGTVHSAAITSATKGRSRPLTWGLWAAAIVLVLALSAAAWDYTLGPFAQSRAFSAQITSDLNKVRADIASLATHSATDQLSILAGDQSLLQSDLGLNVNASQRTAIQTELSGPLASAVQTALSSYNAQAHIVPLSDAGAVTMTVPCASQLVPPLVAVPSAKGAPSGAVTLVARTTGNQLIAVVVANGQATCGNPFGTNITAIAGQNNSVIGLIAATGKTPAEIVALNATTGAPTVILKLPTVGSDVSYSNFVAAPNAIVVVQHTQSSNSDALAVFAGPKFTTNAVKTFPLPHTVRALAFGQNAAVYLLLDSGDLATFVPGSSTDIHIVGGLQIQPALATNGPSSYNSLTPVPTVPGSTSAFIAPLMGTPSFGVLYGAGPDAGTPKPTPTPRPTEVPSGNPAPSTPLASATLLAVDGNATPNVAVADGPGHRVMVLNATGIDLALMQQYADPSQLDHVTAVGFSLDNHTLFALTGTTLIQITLPS